MDYRQLILRMIISIFDLPSQTKFLMELRTQQLIENLLNYDSLSEAVSFVLSEHSILKSDLESKGINFFNDELPLSQDIVSGHNNNNPKVLDDIKYYEELNYIRVGLTKQWIYNVYEPNRYNKIRKSVVNIQDIFKLDARKKVYA